MVWFGFLSTTKVQPCSLLIAPQNCWQVSKITVCMFWYFILVWSLRNHVQSQIPNNCHVTV